MAHALEPPEFAAACQSDVHALPPTSGVDSVADSSTAPCRDRRRTAASRSLAGCSRISQGLAIGAVIPSLFAIARQFGVYLLSGGIAAAANFASGELIRAFSSGAFMYGVSVVVGMTIGTVISFFLHRRFTFAVADEPAAPQSVRFAMVTVGGLLIAFTFAEAVLWLWESMGQPWLLRANVEALAHLGAIGLNTVYGFVAMKFFALKRRNPRRSPGQPMSPTEEPSQP